MNNSIDTISRNTSNSSSARQWPDVSDIIVRQLADAINQNQLFLCYQPRVNVKSGKVVTYEALVRWNHPEEGVLQPDQFIPLAEKSGLIQLLGVWVFERACKDLPMFQVKFGTDIKIAVNVSALQVEDEWLANIFQEICEENNVALSSFEFEITESRSIFLEEIACLFCTEVTKHGATISLDDFGTGNSPLSNLRKLPVSVIKIDRSFVKNIVNDARDEILCSHLIDMAHDLDMQVVAEGVENADQYDLFRSFGCDQVQGYYFDKPRPVHECMWSHQD